MTHEVAAQFAGALSVFGLLPTAQRFGRASGQTRVHTKGVQQTIRREAGHVAPIPIGSVGIDAVREQSHLPHRKRLSAARHWISMELERAFEGRRGHNSLPALPDQAAVCPVADQV